MKIEAIIVDQQEKTIRKCAFDEASLLLTSGKAQVHKLYPYTLMLKSEDDLQKHDMTFSPIPDLLVRRKSPVVTSAEKEVC